MKRILACDGGGARGVFTLQILARLEELFREEEKNENLVLADVFDLIAGTSTGAIIAAFLSWGLPVREIEKLYIDYSPTMFARERWKRWKSIYKPEAIAKFFQTRFTEKDGAPALLGTERLKTLLLIVARNGSTGGSWPVTNNPAALFNLRRLKDGTPNPECNLEFPLWQLLRASTAAPYFFPPEEIKLAGKTHLFTDGGMTPYNNPALIAVLTATLPCYRIQWPATREALHVISVGTGLARARMPGKAAADIHKLDHLKYIPAALIGCVAWEQDFLCRVMGDCVHGAALDFEIGALEMPALLSRQEQKFTYARYDQPLDSTNPRIEELPGGQIELDDLERIPLLQELGKEYANEHVRKEHFYPRGAGFNPCPCSVTSA
ncbi:MAG TPA: patatin-like phospholipase family protein [Verrucomicrobiae bacterium]|nr:patatin-like phospholipase family protein [Verrucomicrobiae bacterium]